MGGKLLGWRTVCAVEIDAYCREVLLARQRDGILEPFPIWDDVRTFNGKPWRGRIDVISGGFPCQDISAAGKGAGINGERSGLWSEMARIVGEVRPRFVFVENSPLLVGRGLAVVLADLAALGYDARWGIVGAHHAGAPHKRDRIWIVGYPDREGESTESQHAEMAGVQEPLAHPDCGGLPESGVCKKQSGGTEVVSASEALADTKEQPERPGLRAIGPGEERRRRLGDGSEGMADSECSPRQLPRVDAGMGRWWEHDPANGPGPSEGSTEPAVGRVANELAP